MTHDDTLRCIAEILWPCGDTDAEWSPDTLDAIAEIMRKAGLAPEGLAPEGSES